jgi:hypothetical protein
MTDVAVIVLVSECERAREQYNNTRFAQLNPFTRIEIDVQAHTNRPTPTPYAPVCDT